MVDVYGGPFATYTDLTGICVANAKTEIRTLMINFMALMSVTMAPDMLTGTLDKSVSAPHPDFDQIPMHIREKFKVEIIAFYAAIEAAPVV